MQDEHTFPQLAEELEPTPKTWDQHIGAEIMPSRGEKMARGHVVAARENMMDRAHANPIMDTRLYQVEFSGSEVTELTANVIAESM